MGHAIGERTSSVTHGYSPEPDTDTCIKARGCTALMNNHRRYKLSKARPGPDKAPRTVMRRLCCSRCYYTGWVERGTLFLRFGSRCTGEISIPIDPVSSLMEFVNFCLNKMFELYHFDRSEDIIKSEGIGK